AEEVIVDNTPPAIDLDPPLTRVRKRQLGKPYECSQQFDPVGEEASNDGDEVPQLMWLKARAEDRGNTALGLAVEHSSLLVHDSVELWVIRANDAPLIADTNGHTFCDDLNPH